MELKTMEENMPDFKKLSREFLNNLMGGSGKCPACNSTKILITMGNDSGFRCSECGQVWTTEAMTNMNKIAVEVSKRVKERKAQKESSN
jgi:transposase-like protein